MAYNTKPIVTDKDGNPISQYYNPDTDSYEPVEGSHGANKVLVENNDLSLIPILEKLSQLTGTVIDEETRKSNELERIDNEDSRQSNENVRNTNEIARVEDEDTRIQNENTRVQNEDIRQANEQNRIDLYNDLMEKVSTGYFDGKNLEFHWNGTSLGVRVEGETEYIYVDLKGETGDIENLTMQHVINALGYTPIKSVNNVVADEIGNVELDIDTSEIENRIGNVEDDLVAHKAEKATQTTLGHVKAGNNITIDADGTINAKGGNVDSVNGKTGEVILSASDVGAVPTSRRVNNKALTRDITIDVSDIPGLVGSRLGLGSNASAGGTSAVALGHYASVTGEYSVALGASASTTGRSSVALGYDASATSTGSVALGHNASAGTLAVALGRDASAGDYAVALGWGTSAGNVNEGILGGTAINETSKWIVPGSFTVNGTKNFEIPHPKPEKKATHVIRHGAVESPTPGDTLYRYKITATKDNDLVAIDLPDYFVWLNKDVQIWVTGQGHFGNGYGELNRETEQLEIHCQFAGEYNVLVIGTRDDDHQSVQDWNIKGVEREIGESWTGETYVFSVDEILEIEEIKEVVI